MKIKLTGYRVMRKAVLGLWEEIGVIGFDHRQVQNAKIYTEQSLRAWIRTEHPNVKLVPQYQRIG